jgi:hypothetical protein
VLTNDDKKEQEFKNQQCRFDIKKYIKAYYGGKLTLTISCFTFSFERN